MKTVSKIIEILGGLAALESNPIKLVIKGFMPLCIEHIDTGPRGWPLVSVCHYFEQNGDLMWDPDMTFEIMHPISEVLFHAEDPKLCLKSPLGLWLPVSYRQDSMGIDQEAVFVGDGERVMVRPAMIKDLRAFAATWDHNIRDQGFVDAARQQAEANRVRDELVRVGKHAKLGRLRNELIRVVKAEKITAVYGVDAHRIAKELAATGEYDYTGKELSDEQVTGLEAGWAAGWLSQP